MATDHRERLIRAGVAVVHERGFGTTGVREIASAAGVPHGSFTNHFRSKEAFGALVLERYYEALDQIMRETLENPALDPLARIWSYFDRVASLVAEGNWRCGCMIPDLAAEVPPHSETIRLRLQDVLQDQACRFERAVGLAQHQWDDVHDDLGSFVLAAWHGTLLRMKVERDGVALDRFRRVLEMLIGAPEVD